MTKFFRRDLTPDEYSEHDKQIDAFIDAKFLLGVGRGKLEGVCFELRQEFDLQLTDPPNYLFRWQKNLEARMESGESVITVQDIKNEME